MSSFQQDGSKMNATPQATQKATQQTVTSVHRWTDKLLTFTTTKPDGYSFTAGQYARMGLPDESGMIWRAYSMTSAPSDAELEFYGIIVEGGLFTTQLDGIKPGDPIWIERQPYGFMTVDRFTDGNDLWMLSTGTGIGPFISILRDPYVWGRFHNLVLVHCVRHADELAYRDELTALAQNPPGNLSNAGRLQVIRSVTRDEPADSKTLSGRITTLLQNGELEQRAGLPLSVEGSRIMLCGNPEMIEETRRLLHERGMRPVRRAIPGQFVTENYW
ncbi:ferredoxin--NADP reductase [Noviherbaspirillum sp.]|uniref:ferredoxin--NADP reductase n=1 Tax=Noviherbaspirillum sp. TaxID=1926288 RepID=UPI002FE14F20